MVSSLFKVQSCRRSHSLGRITDVLHSGGLADAAGTDLQRAKTGLWLLMSFDTLGSVLTTHLTEINQSQRADPSGWLFRGTFTDTKRGKKIIEVIHEALFAAPICSSLHALHHQRGFYTQQQVLVGEHGKGWLKMYFYIAHTCRRCKLAAAGVLHTFALSALFFYCRHSTNRFCLILTWHYDELQMSKTSPQTTFWCTDDDRIEWLFTFNALKISTCKKKK